MHKTKMVFLLINTTVLIHAEQQNVGHTELLKFLTTKTSANNPKKDIISVKDKEPANSKDKAKATISSGHNVENKEVEARLLALLMPSEADKKYALSQKKYYKGEIERLGIKYLDSLAYNLFQSSIPYIRFTELSALDQYNLSKYGYLLEQKYEVPWYMRFISETVGYGVFAAVNMEPEDFIGEYTGIIYDEKTFQNQKPLDTNYAWNINSPPYYKESLRIYVDAKNACNFTRFINHSYTPNVKPMTIYAKDGWHMIYVAAKAIKKDEQLLVDYGKGYWSGRTPESLE